MAVRPRDALTLMKTALEGRGVSTMASVEFTRKDLRHEGKVKDLIEQIQAAG